MFRLAALALVLAGCVPMQQASAPPPVVPLDQRIRDETLKKGYDGCLEQKIHGEKAPEWCRCLFEKNRLYLSSAMMSEYVVQRLDNQSHEEVPRRFPAIGAIRAMCLREVQPY